MKGTLIPVLLCCGLALGTLHTCETKIGNKGRDQNNLFPQLGHPYTGVVSAAAGICFVKAPWMTKPQAVLVAPFWILTVASTPAAIVSDTLVLPIDLFFDSEVQRTTFSQYCSYYAQDYLRPPGAAEPRR